MTKKAFAPGKCFFYWRIFLHNVELTGAYHFSYYLPPIKWKRAPEPYLSKVWELLNVADEKGVNCVYLKV